MLCYDFPVVQSHLTASGPPSGLVISPYFGKHTLTGKLDLKARLQHQTSRKNDKTHSYGEDLSATRLKSTPLYHLLYSKWDQHLQKEHHVVLNKT